jgi:MOSC domain-containing protein
VRVAEIWRFPVKSMAGERLKRAELRATGIEGDRLVLVRDPGGRIVTARSRPLLLGHRATLSGSGEPLVDGRPWDSPEVARDVRLAAGAGARLERAAIENRFDVLPLLVATDGALEAFGHDSRRLRPNLVIGGVPGLAEREWAGRRLRVGDALIGALKLRQRCVMTTYDPETLEQDVSVLRDIQRDFGGLLALDCFVERPAAIAEGEEVELLES